MITQSIPPIKLLREQISKKHTEQPWHRMMRTISIYPTWLLLHTPISANGVTLLFLLTGLAGAALFALGGFWSWIAGMLCIWLSVVLDFSDGEVARFRRQSSWFGDYLDETCHSVLLIALYAGMSLGAWRLQPGNPWLFMCAFVAAGATIVTRTDAALIVKALIQYYGVERLPHVMPNLAASTFSATANMNRWLYGVDMLIFDLGFYFITLPIAVLAQRIDLFLYFYGVARPLSALYMFWRSWQHKQHYHRTKEEIALRGEERYGEGHAVQTATTLRSTPISDGGA